jgi:hypothetical protein
MIVEPVALQDFLAAVLSGASVLLAGMAYAALFGFSRVYRIPALMPVAYVGYGMLVLAAATLANALHFSGPWLVMTYVILVAYLLAPHAVWHLCGAIHGSAADEPEGDA